MKRQNARYGRGIARGASACLIFLLAAVLPAAAERQAIDAPIVVQAGNTLTIQAGSELFFAPFTGVTVKRGGRLYAQGTKERPVKFTSVKDTAGTGAAFDWNGIEIESGGVAALSYCLIANAAAGVTAADSGGASLTQCIFSNNGQWDLSVAGVTQLFPDDKWPYDYAPRPERAAAAPELVIPPPVIPPPDVTAAPGLMPTPPKSQRRQMAGWIIGGAGAAAAVAGVAFLLQAINHSAEYDADAAIASNTHNNGDDMPIEIPGPDTKPGTTDETDRDVLTLSGSEVRSVDPQGQTRHFDNLRKKRDTATTIGLSFLGLTVVNGICLFFLF